VKLHGCQYGTRQSVLGGRGWGEEELLLLKFAVLPNVNIRSEYWSKEKKTLLAF
jgi:hypothetical protein